MKGFIGVTDNDWFVCVTLLKEDWPKAQGLRHKAAKSDWAKRGWVNGIKRSPVPLTSSDIP